MIQNQQKCFNKQFTCVADVNKMNDKMLLLYIVLNNYCVWPSDITEMLYKS